MIVKSHQLISLVKNGRFLLSRKRKYCYCQKIHSHYRLLKIRLLGIAKKKPLFASIPRECVKANLSSIPSTKRESSILRSPLRFFKKSRMDFVCPQRFLKLFRTGTGPRREEEWLIYTPFPPPKWKSNRKKLFFRNVVWNVCYRFCRYNVIFATLSSKIRNFKNLKPKYTKSQKMNVGNLIQKQCPEKSLSRFGDEKSCLYTRLVVIFSGSSRNMSSRSP